MVQYRANPQGEVLFGEGYSGTIFSYSEEKINEVMSIGTPAAYSQVMEVFTEAYGAMMGCGACSRYFNQHDYEARSLVISLRDNVAVCPTHYSIQHGGCSGMSGYWNFDASVDGESWVTIHKARDCTSGRCFANSDDEIEEYMMILDEARKQVGKKNRKEAVCEYMEQNHRYTFKVDNSGDFYTHFRFMSVEVLDGREYDCLHAFGFEVYGKVYEEWGDQSGGDTGRIEKLEAQIDELEAQNDKLQAHNKALESRVEYLERKCEGA